MEKTNTGQMFQQVWSKRRSDILFTLWSKAQKSFRRCKSKCSLVTHYYLGVYSFFFFVFIFFIFCFVKQYLIKKNISIIKKDNFSFNSKPIIGEYIEHCPNKGSVSWFVATCLCHNIILLIVCYILDFSCIWAELSVVKWKWCDFANRRN